MFALLLLVDKALSVLEILLLVRVLLSFFPAWARSPLGKVVVSITEPILQPLRKGLQIRVTSSAALDFSPMVAMILIQIVRSLLRF